MYCGIKVCSLLQSKLTNICRKVPRTNKICPFLLWLLSFIFSFYFPKHRPIQTEHKLQHTRSISVAYVQLEIWALQTDSITDNHAICVWDSSSTAHLSILLLQISTWASERHSVSWRWWTRQQTHYSSKKPFTSASRDVTEKLLNRDKGISILNVGVMILSLDAIRRRGWSEAKAETDVWSKRLVGIVWKQILQVR